MARERDHKIIKKELNFLLKKFYFISGHIPNCPLSLYTSVACFHACTINCPYGSQRWNSRVSIITKKAWSCLSRKFINSVELP